MDYTAHEVLSKEKDIPIRMDEIKKAVSRTHPDKKVTFELLQALNFPFLKKDKKKVN